LPLFPVAWKPDARHRSRIGPTASSIRLCLDRSHRPPDAKRRAERSFTKDRRVIDMAGLLGDADTVDSLTLMAKEIMPRLKEQRVAAQNAAT
jgi:hypothetical protein